MGGEIAAQHRELARGRWERMPLKEQMAHVGSEISRALKWRARQKNDFARKAAERALELLSLTIDSAGCRARVKELARAREALNDFFYGGNEFGSSAASWEKYFGSFARAVRKDS